MDSADHYWLQVSRDGTEQRYQNKPDVPALFVTLAGGVETTRTFNPRTMVGPWHARLMVRPRGSGWVVSDESHDAFTVWQRPRI